MASTFLNKSGILNSMKFRSYQSKRLTEQRGEHEPEKDCFEWIEPFKGNSYFEVNRHKGVMSEDELKELCYALLVDKKNIGAVEDKISQFLTKYKNADNIQKVENDEMLDRKYFPANYFAEQDVGSIKDRILKRLKKSIKSYKDKDTDVKAYDKMREVMEFINNSLPADEKMKKKDYKRYLKMVRFWGSEKSNIEREFKAKEWSKYFSSGFWAAKELEDAYKSARQKNSELFIKLNSDVEKINAKEFEKYQQINDSKDLAGLRQLAQDFKVEWKEKDWQEYSGQIKKEITERRKLTIMKQKVTAELKKKQKGDFEQDCDSERFC
jgi:hypothetical protein